MENSAPLRRVFRYSLPRKRDVPLFEMTFKLTRSCPRLRDAIRLGVLAYLAVVLGAGAALRNVHVESSEHGHRYCPEHEQIEAVEHGEGAEPDDSQTPEILNDEQAIPPVHVACALLNALLSRAPVAPDVRSMSTPTVGATRAATAFVERFDPFESVLSLAPKTSPPFVTA